MSVIFFETPIPELSKTTTEYFPEMLTQVVATALFSLYASFSICTIISCPGLALKVLFFSLLSVNCKKTGYSSPILTKAILLGRTFSIFPTNISPTEAFSSFSV